MIYEVISGALMMACLVTGLFFISFWKKTYDRLFLIFSFAFFLLAVERMVLGYLGNRSEPSPEIYYIRLSAFVMILIAIIDKNRTTEK
jgi:hypothetical protein